MKKKSPKLEEQKARDVGITKITVAGFKSIARETSIDIRSLTVLAGANSSGNSSMMQPLLLLKQTFEALYDPGILLLDGPHVKFTNFDQMISVHRLNNPMSFGYEVNKKYEIINYYERSKLEKTHYRTKSNGYEIKEKMEEADERKIGRECKDYLSIVVNKVKDIKMKYYIRRGFFVCYCECETYRFDYPVSGRLELVGSIQSCIHVPGLRGNPERSYPRSSIGPLFSGPFTPYTASVIEEWQNSDPSRFEMLHGYLKKIGVSQIEAIPINSAYIELKISRLELSDNEKTDDTVNVADVGSGISHNIPVFVALVAAKPGQLVYIEQPELHLHPKAQRAMAHILVDAAKRGVKVVVETHSHLLLLGIQTLIAKGEIDPDDVALHWFTRDPKTGVTEVKTAELDASGAFGEWPEDFSDTELDTEKEYLDAAGAKMWEKNEREKAGEDRVRDRYFDCAVGG